MAKQGFQPFKGWKPYQCFKADWRGFFIMYISGNESVSGNFKMTIKLNMENRTKGAWIINHTKKLQDFSETANFEDIQLAGKCGMFLSNLAASNEETQISKDKVDAIATNSNINKKLELPAIKETLKNAQLIDYNSKGDIAVLGITTANILNHTADLFEQNESSAYQKAALEISNYVSDKPVDEAVLKEYISDTFKIDSQKQSALFTQSEEVGFVDFEKIDDEKTYKLFWN